jgi:hypothetical protein
VPITDRAELKRLILQLERDLVAQAALKSLLGAADVAVADSEHELRVAKARIKRHA